MPWFGERTRSSFSPPRGACQHNSVQSLLRSLVRRPSQGHLLPPFPDAQPTGSEPSRAAGGEGIGGKQQQKQQQQQQKSQAEQQEDADHGMCSWDEAPSRRKQQAEQGQREGGAAAGGSGSSSSGGSAEQEKATLERVIEQQVEDKCRRVCAQGEATAAALSQAAAVLRRAMPLLPLPAGAPALLRARRCTACREVTRTLRRLQLGKSLLTTAVGQARVQAAAAKVRLSNRPAFSASGLQVNRQFLCVIEVRYSNIS